MTCLHRGTFYHEKAEQIEGLVIEGFEIVWDRVRGTYGREILGDIYFCESKDSLLFG